MTIDILSPTCRVATTAVWETKHAPTSHGRRILKEPGRIVCGTRAVPRDAPTTVSTTRETGLLHGLVQPATYPEIRLMLASSVGDDKSLDIKYIFEFSKCK